MNCPNCNTPNVYIGFTTVECTNPSCVSYKPGFAGLNVELSDVTPSELMFSSIPISWDKAAGSVVIPAPANGWTLRPFPAPANGWTWYRSELNANLICTAKDRYSVPRFVYNATTSTITVEEQFDTIQDISVWMRYQEVTPDVARQTFNGKTFNSQLGPRP